MCECTCMVWCLACTGCTGATTAPALGVACKCVAHFIVILDSMQVTPVARVLCKLQKLAGAWSPGDGALQEALYAGVRLT